MAMAALLTSASGRRPVHTSESTCRTLRQALRTSRTASIREEALRARARIRPLGGARLNSVSLLPGSWEFTVPGYCFVAVAFLASLLVRVVSATLKSIERERTGCKSSEDGWWQSFLGKGKNGDALHGLWIGWLEFLGYPVLLVTGRFEAIGAWLALKALPPWATWEKNRRAYARFLICNLLVVGISLLWMTRCVKPTTAQAPAGSPSVESTATPAPEPPTADAPADPAGDNDQPAAPADSPAPEE
jgi:hypothetical protein